MSLRKTLSVLAYKPPVAGHHYGYIPDLVDSRDFLYRAIKPSSLTPDQYVSTDLTKWCSPVKDQLTEGSCTSQCLSSHVEWLENKDHTATTQWKAKILSPQFLYYCERALEGTTQTDAGAMIRDGIKCLASTGICPEVIWPYSKPFYKAPNANAYFLAKNRVISSYHRLDTLDDVLACLTEGYPFVLGISVYESFETQQVMQTGMVPMPKPGERLLGGHGIFGCASDLTKKLIKIKNSWGTSVGDGGYFYLPFDYITAYASDMWTIRSGSRM